MIFLISSEHTPDSHIWDLLFLSFVVSSAVLSVVLDHVVISL